VSHIKPLIASKNVLQPGLKLALALICAVAPASGLPYQNAFDGLLVSDNPSDPPVPIALKLEVNLAGISGSVTTGSPQPGAGVLRGAEQFGTCELRSDLGRLTLLRMTGGCSPTMSSFSGKYVLSLNSGKRQAGSFKLAKPSTQGGSAGSALGQSLSRSGEMSGLTYSRCLRGNTACLLACPRGDQNAELLCANRCKQKLKACKGSKSWSLELPDPHEEELKSAR